MSSAGVVSTTASFATLVWWALDVVPHRRPSLVSQPVEHHVPTDPIEVGGRIADMTVVQFRNPDEDILHKIFRRLGRF